MVVKIIKKHKKKAEKLENIKNDSRTFTNKVVCLIFFEFFQN